MPGAMAWALRLKRVFDIGIETCRACGGAVKAIACIGPPDQAQEILRGETGTLITPEVIDIKWWT